MNTPAPVVSNSGPLMVLSKLNLLHLLKEIYGRVHFARSVYEETVVLGMRQGYEDAKTLSFFLDQSKWTPDSVDQARTPTDLKNAPLDLGERDTLTLAVVLKSELILIDETVGRQIARDRGFAVRGSLGILIEAYRRNLMTMDQLRLNLTEVSHRQDIWLAPALVERVLDEILNNHT